MATMPNTNINIPYSAFLDPTTGRPSQAWLLWLMSPTFINVNIGSALPVTSGGTGLTTIPTNGQLLIGDGGGYTLNTLGFGAGISVTNGSGTITVANTGVLSNLAGSGISVSSATGNVTIGNTGVLSFSSGTTGLTPSAATTGAVTLAGTLIAANGGTGFASYAVGDLLYANTTTTLAKLADVATGNALISGGVATAPAWGKIGLTTHVSGILPIANGGTNGTSTPTAGAVPYGTGTAYAFTAAGTTGQVLTSAGASVPIWTTPTTGTVTSVGLAMPTQFAVTNSPVTSSGTLTAAWNTQSANVLLAGPASGAGAVPTFRALTTADLPALPYGTGTVTSVGLSLPSIIAVTNSPVTTSGTLTGTLTTQAVNAIFAGPSSGAAAAPTFRALTTADIPTLAYGSVTSVSFTGGIVSVATPTTTPALTVAGTSGGVPYFSSGTTWASSAALAANALVIGGGAGVAPSTTTTGTGVVTALGVNTGTAGAFVVNGGVLGTPSSGTVTNLTGTASININGTVGATTPASGAFTSVSDSGNLTFTGTGTRITGLMDGATIANILAFQTNTANAGTRLSILTNGTGTASSLDIYGASDPTNTSSLRLRTSGTDASIRSDITGTGTYQPMTFYTGGSERVRIIGGTGSDVGNVGVGTTTPSASALLDVQSTTKGVRMPNMTTTQKNAISSPAAGLMVFDTTLAKLCVYSGAAWQTITSI